ncbi:MAG: hypothetical protein ABIQ64_00270 [Candidatus Saccharimonadales bacterium]
MDLRSQQRVQSEARPVAASQAPIQQTNTGQPSQSRRTSGKRGFGSKKAIITAIVALLIVAGLVAAYMTWQSGLGAIKRDRYQAVFLTNGQVYFGKINSMTGDTVVLKDIYYLQQAADVQKQEDEKDQAQNQLTLAKLGKELHGPEDVMYLERSQMLFWENLTNDSQVVKNIQQEKKQD